MTFSAAAATPPQPPRTFTDNLTDL